MYCSRCGHELKGNEKFCGRCGRSVGGNGSQPLRQSEYGRLQKSGRLKGFIVVAVACCCAVAVAGFYVVGSNRVAMSSEQAFAEYEAVFDGVTALTSSFADDDGYYDGERVPDVLAAAESFAKGDGQGYIDSYEVGDDYVEFRLKSGFVYIFCPSVPHTLSPSVDMQVNTYETTADDFKDDRKEAIDNLGLTIVPSTVPLVDNSLVDADAWYIMNNAGLGNLRMLDDDDVTVDVMKQFNKGEFVIWEGHGGWTQDIGTYLCLTQKCNRSAWDRMWDSDDVGKGNMVSCNGKLAVTPQFFRAYYKDGDLDGALFYIGSCNSLKDNRLADVIVEKGAIGVIGNTETVSTYYQFQMRDAVIQELVDSKVPLEDALEFAKSVYGPTDPWHPAEKTEVRIYPETAKNFSLYLGSEKPADKIDAGHASLEATASQLAAKDYSAEYLYRARGYTNNPNFEWVVSDDLPDGAVVGTQIADYDGDGDEELLAVLWRNDTIDFDMYEVNGGAVKLAASMSDAATLVFPVKGNGALDVATDSDGALFMQWWYHTAPVADGHEWVVMRIDYDGKRFRASDSATVAGTGMLSLKELKSDMQGLGLNTAYVPDEDSGEFTASSIADLDPTLRLVARATAWVDNEAVAETAFREMQSGSASWGELKYLGEFRIGSGVTSERQQGAKDSQAGNAKSESGSSENDFKSAVTSSAKHEILHWFYADFDADGDSEAFAVTGLQDEQFENEWSDGEVWYADEQGVKRLGGQEAGNAINGLVEDAASGYKFLSLERTAHGSGTTSSVFVASKGSCVEAQFDLTHVGAFHEEDGQLVGYSNKWDNGFHEYEWHSFEFNPASLTFKSTGDIAVTTWRQLT